MYIVDQILPHVTLETNPHSLVEFLVDSQDFNTWCYDRRIPIHGKKYAHLPNECEYVDLSDDQRFEFKMRWGY
jgi:hypothetical protein